MRDARDAEDKRLLEEGRIDELLSGWVETIQGRTRLMDVLREDDYEIFELTVQKGATKPLEFPVSKTKQWSIVIVDEGAPEPQVGHFKYAAGWSRKEFFDRAKTNKIAVNQLTVTNHYHDTMLQRAIIDPVDVAYFVGIMAISLFVGTQILSTRRWRP